MLVNKNNFKIYLYSIILIIVTSMGSILFYNKYDIQIYKVNKTIKTVPMHIIFIGECDKINNSFNFTTKLGFLPQRVLIGVRIPNELKNTDTDDFNKIAGVFEIFYKGGLIGTTDFDLKSSTCSVDIDKGEVGIIIYTFPYTLNCIDEYTLKVGFKTLPPIGTKLYLYGP